MWKKRYGNVCFDENIQSVVDISQRYQSGNYQLQLDKLERPFWEYPPQ